jgi:hypothetical protein
LGGDAADAGPVPRLFVALTLQVYVLPTVRAITVSGLARPTFILLIPPFDDTHVAVKLVIAAPLFAPGVNATRS